MTGEGRRETAREPRPPDPPATEQPSSAKGIITPAEDGSMLSKGLPSTRMRAAPVTGEAGLTVMSFKARQPNVHKEYNHK